MVMNLKTLVAGAGLSLLASGALALTPVSGKVLTPNGAPKSAPTWMEFKPERNDTLYGACTGFLEAAGLTKKYSWGDCAGVVVKLNGGMEKFLPDLKLRQDVTYFFPVVVSTTGRAEQPVNSTAVPQADIKLALELAKLREVVDGNLPAMANAINTNSTNIASTSRRLDELTADVKAVNSRLDDQDKVNDVLADWAESNQTLAEQASRDATAAWDVANSASTQAEQNVLDIATNKTAIEKTVAQVTELANSMTANESAAKQNASDIAAIKVTTEQNTSAIADLQAQTGGSSTLWAAIASAIALAVLGLLFAWKNYAAGRKTTDRLQKVEDDVAGQRTSLEHTEGVAEAADVKAQLALQAMTGRGIDWDASQLEDLKVFADDANIAESAVWTLMVDGQQVQVVFTWQADDRMAWNVPTKDGAVRQPLVKLSTQAVQHKLNQAYDDGCLDGMKQPAAVTSLVA